ncbi:MAG: hypothetical protein AAF415_02815 [Pseudomonadota bacterium]
MKTIREMLSAPALAVAALALASPLALAFRPADGDGLSASQSELLVIAAPWQTAASIVDQAGGLVVARSPLPFLAVSFLPSPDHADRLRQAGAWQVLNGDLGDFLCI